MAASFVSARDAYLADRDTQPYAGISLAFYAKDLGKILRNRRYFLAVADVDCNEVMKIFRSPVVNGTNRESVDAAFLKKMRELWKEYKEPAFDVVMGSGTTRSFLDEFGFGVEVPCYRWENASVEDFQI